MINIGAVDTHTPIPTRMNIRVNLQLSCAIPVASQYVTKPEVRFIRIPVDQQLVHYAIYLVTGIVLFSRYRVSASL